MAKRIFAWFLTVSMVFGLFTVSVSAQTNMGNELGSDRSLTSVREQDGVSASFTRNSPGFAGKSTDDTVQKMEITQAFSQSNQLMASGGYPRYEITHNFDFSSNTHATFQANIFTQGDVSVGLSFHTRDLLRWDVDGSLYGVTYAGVDDYYPVHTKIATLKRGFWHTIAVTFCSETLEQKIYADGKYLVTIKRPNYPATHKTMRIGAWDCQGDGAGVIAIDDVYSYPGEYDEAENSIVLSDDELIGFNSDENVITYNEDNFSDVSSLREHLLNASNAKDIVITDKSFSPLENALPGEALCIMTLPSGIGFYTFEIQPLFSIGDVTATDIDGKTKISATVTNRHSESRTVTMIAALRDDEGSLSKVFSSETVAVSASEELVIENIDTSTGSVYVFFIESWTLPRAVSSMLVNVTNNVTS